jgi:chemotaxis signal transduction protein
MAETTDAVDRDETLLRQRAERFARRSEDQEDQDSVRIVGLRRGEASYGVDLDGLVEIRTLRHFCSIPGASSVVPGVFYHRGEILSAHDLHAYLSGGGHPGAPTWVLVCDQGGFMFGLLADEVTDIEEVPVAGIRDVPASFGERRASFRGLTRDGTLLLDLRALLEDAEFATAF